METRPLGGARPPPSDEDTAIGVKHARDMPNINAIQPPADPLGRRPQDRNVLAREEWQGLRPHKLVARLSASQEVGDALLSLGATLMDEIDPRTRGLIVLHTCAMCNNTYGWRAQVAIVLSIGR